MRCERRTLDPEVVLIMTPDEARELASLAWWDKVPKGRHVLNRIATALAQAGFTYLGTEFSGAERRLYRSVWE